MKKRSKAIILYNLDRTVYGYFNSITEAANIINCGDKTIRRALKTDKKILKGKYIVNYNKELNYSPMSLNFYAIFIKK